MRTLPEQRFSSGSRNEITSRAWFSSGSRYEITSRATLDCALARLCQLQAFRGRKRMRCASI